MTIDAPPAGHPAPAPVAAPQEAEGGNGSWLPTGAMVRAKILELRKRRGLMIAVLFLTIGLPVLVLGIRLIAHLAAPHSYGPAGSPSVFQGLSQPMAEFGFIIAATLGATAGSSDLTDGVFRHLVVTGRSRVSMYLARIPAGLSIILPLVGAAFALLCLVTAFAGTPQPTSVNENGVAVPLHLDQSQLEHWLLDHPNRASQAFVPGGGPGPGGIRILKGGVSVQIAPGPGFTVRSFVTNNIGNIYSNYLQDELTTLNPPVNQMVKIGLWVELEVLIGFMVGLGLAALLGQRTVAAILMIALEIIITPILANVTIPYFLNGQRVIVGVAMDQLRPSGLAGMNGRRIFGGHGALGIPPMPTWAMVTVIVGWIVGWSVIGAWRMATRDV